MTVGNCTGCGYENNIPIWIYKSPKAIGNIYSSEIIGKDLVFPDIINHLHCDGYLRENICSLEEVQEYLPLPVNVSRVIF